MTHLFVRRVLATAGAMAVVSATVIGCSSSNDDSASTTTTATSAAAAVQSTAAQADSNDPAVKEITDAFVAFFDGKTPADTKAGLVENGSTFAPTLAAQASSPMAAGSTATVSSVKLDDSAHASVTYTVLINGNPALPNQAGKAISVDGKWKVAAATYCGLLKLQGGAPASC
ncbi:hypothetical protein [Nocardia pseudovaccinii]|uniref:hypothetical protein n=1 Tax=Nocardia pseudovaccinii TaxID=189540 RepID=UPI0007A527FA|nr:hypothetical protein [Nocardia pseudovaccinii]